MTLPPGANIGRKAKTKKKIKERLEKKLMGYKNDKAIDATQGGLTGAGTGAALGSMAGPIGTAVGAGVGGLVGVLATKPWEKKKKPSKKIDEFGRAVSAFNTGGAVTGSYEQSQNDLEGTDMGGFVATKDSPMLNEEPYNEDFSF